MQVEDRLAAGGTDVDEHAIVLEPGLARGPRDELEHPLRLVRRELADVAERVDVPLGQDEQVRLRLRVDVPDRDDAVALRDVVALADELAEQAVWRPAAHGRASGEGLRQAARSTRRVARPDCLDARRGGRDAPRADPHPEVRTWAAGRLGDIGEHS